MLLVLVLFGTWQHLSRVLQPAEPRLLLHLSHGSSSSSSSSRGARDNDATQPPAIIQEACALTVVTAYFEVPSKHSPESYRAWMTSGVLSLDACIVVIVGSEDDARFVAKTSQGRITPHVVDLSSAAQRLGGPTNRSVAFWEQQFRIDPEAHLHKGYRLYWIWALKAVFLRDAAVQNPFGSTHFVWVDIGCIRDARYRGRTLRAPPPRMLKEETSIWCVAVAPFESAGASASQDHVAGAIWGGSAAAVLRFHDAYFRVFTRLADAGAFVGKDQTLMNQACMENAGLCALVRPDASVYNEWFFMLPFLLGDVVDVTVDLYSSSNNNNNNAGKERILIATMLTDDVERYAQGACALRRSIVIMQGSSSRAVIDFKAFELDTKPIADPRLRDSLTQAGWTLASMPRIAPRSGAETFGRFIDQFSKLNLWNMVEYDRVLYFDSDCLVVGTLDALLAINVSDAPLWVTRDIRAGQWVDGFNMGVFMIQPSAAEFARLMRAKDDPAVAYETMMSEQGLLNAVYRGVWRDFGFRNNANLAAFTDDPALWAREQREGLNVIHYTMNKPWECGPAYAAVCALWAASSSSRDAARIDPLGQFK